MLQEDQEILRKLADPSKAFKDLNWKAKFDLEQMIFSSWNAWQKHNPINEK